MRERYAPRSMLIVVDSWRVSAPPCALCSPQAGCVSAAKPAPTAGPASTHGEPRVLEGLLCGQPHGRVLDEKLGDELASIGRHRGPVLRDRDA